MQETSFTPPTTQASWAKDAASALATIPQDVRVRLELLALERCREASVPWPSKVIFDFATLDIYNEHHLQQRIPTQMQQLRDRLKPHILAYQESEERDRQTRIAQHKQSIRPTSYMEWLPFVGSRTTARLDKEYESIPIPPTRDYHERPPKQKTCKFTVCSIFNEFPSLTEIECIPEREGGRSVFQETTVKYAIDQIISNLEIDKDIILMNENLQIINDQPYLNRYCFSDSIDGNILYIIPKHPRMYHSIIGAPWCVFNSKQYLLYERNKIQMNETQRYRLRSEIGDKIHVTLIFNGTTLHVGTYMNTPSSDFPGYLRNYGGPYVGEVIPSKFDEFIPSKFDIIQVIIKCASDLSGIHQSQLVVNEEGRDVPLFSEFQMIGHEWSGSNRRSLIVRVEEPPAYMQWIAQPQRQGGRSSRIKYMKPARRYTMKIVK